MMTVAVHVQGFFCAVSLCLGSVIAVAGERRHAGVVNTTRIVQFDFDSTVDRPSSDTPPPGTPIRVGNRDLTCRTLGVDVNGKPDRAGSKIAPSGISRDGIAASPNTNARPTTTIGSVDASIPPSPTAQGSESDSKAKAIEKVRLQQEVKLRLLGRIKAFQNPDDCWHLQRHRDDAWGYQICFWAHIFQFEKLRPEGMSFVLGHFGRQVIHIRFESSDPASAAESVEKSTSSQQSNIAFLIDEARNLPGLPATLGHARSDSMAKWSNIEENALPTLDTLPIPVLTQVMDGLARDTASITIVQEFFGGDDGRSVRLEIDCGEWAPSKTVINEHVMYRYEILAKSPELCSKRELENFLVTKYFGTVDERLLGADHISEATEDLEKKAKLRASTSYRSETKEPEQSNSESEHNSRSQTPEQILQVSDNSCLDRNSDGTCRNPDMLFNETLALDPVDQGVSDKTSNFESQGESKADTSRYSPSGSGATGSDSAFSGDNLPEILDDIQHPAHPSIFALGFSTFAQFSSLLRFLDNIFSRASSVNDQRAEIYQVSPWSSTNLNKKGSVGSTGDGSISSSSDAEKRSKVRFGNMVGTDYLRYYDNAAPGQSLPSTLLFEMVNAYVYLPVVEWIVKPMLSALLDAGSKIIGEEMTADLRSLQQKYSRHLVLLDMYVRVPFTNLLSEVQLCFASLLDTFTGAYLFSPEPGKGVAESTETRGSLRKVYDVLVNQARSVASFSENPGGAEKPDLVGTAASQGDGQAEPKLVASLYPFRTMHDGAHNGVLPPLAPEFESLVQNNLPLVHKLMPMFGQCLHASLGYWEYEFCYPYGVRQFHRSANGQKLSPAYSLGFSESVLPTIANVRLELLERARQLVVAEARHSFLVSEANPSQNVAERVESVRAHMEYFGINREVVRTTAGPVEIFKQDPEFAGANVDAAAQTSGDLREAMMVLLNKGEGSSDTKYKTAWKPYRGRGMKSSERYTSRLRMKRAPRLSRKDRVRESESEKRSQLDRELDELDDDPVRPELDTTPDPELETARWLMLHKSALGRDEKLEALRDKNKASSKSEQQRARSTVGSSDTSYDGGEFRNYAEKPFKPGVSTEKYAVRAEVADVLELDRILLGSNVKRKRKSEETDLESAISDPYAADENALDYVLSEGARKRMKSLRTMLGRAFQMQISSRSRKDQSTTEEAKYALTQLSAPNFRTDFAAFHGDRWIPAELKRVLEREQATYDQAGNTYQNLGEPGQVRFVVDPLYPRLDIPIVTERVRPLHLPKMALVKFPRELFTRPDFFKMTNSDSEAHIDGWKAQSDLRALWMPLESGTRCDETGRPRRTDMFLLCPSGPNGGGGSTEGTSSAFDITDPTSAGAMQRHFQRSDHPRFQQYMRAPDSRRAEPLKADYVAGFKAGNSSYRSSYWSLREARQKAARRQNNAARDDRDYGSHTKFWRGQTSWADPVQMKKARKRLDGTDLASVWNGAKKKQDTTKSSPHDISIPKSDPVESDVISAASKSHDTDSATNPAQDGASALDFDLSELLVNSHDETVSSTGSSTPQMNIDLVSDLESTSPVADASPYLYSAFSANTDFIASESESHSQPQDSSTPAGQNQFPQVDLLLNYVLPGAPDIMAIGETLCEYVLLVSAPQVCGMPALHDGGIFGTPLEKQAGNDSQQAATREILECS